MNLNDPRHPWSRLTAAARRTPDVRDATAPYGFAARVTTLAMAGERNDSLLERMALRAVGVASLLALLSVVANYSALTRANSGSAVLTEDVALPVDDAIAAVLDFAD